MLETLAELVDDGRLPKGMTREEAQRRAVKGIAKGLLKTMSKMGISTIPSYCGAQIFEAVGLAPELVERHFTGTASRIGGIGLETLAEETLARHARAYPGRARTSCCRSSASTRGGATASTTSGTPRRSRCSSTRCAHGGWETYEEYSRAVNDETRAAARCAACSRSASPRTAGSRSTRSSRRRRS